jgi:hypothetical protein
VSLGRAAVDLDIARSRMDRMFEPVRASRTKTLSFALHEARCQFHFVGLPTATQKRIVELE